MHKNYIYLFLMLLYFLPTLADYNPFLGSESPELVVIIPSYNNEKYYYANLESVIHQETTVPFLIIYIDDCSTDNTGQLVDNYVRDNNVQNLVRVIHNSSRVGALANLYTTIHNLPDSAIVVLLDGDDWLAHNKALESIIQTYKNKNIWFAYSQMLYLSSNEIYKQTISERVNNENSFRDNDWVTRHIKTFYAGLFKKINLHDLLYRGKFYPMAGDLAFVFPMLEMATKDHIGHIPEVLYVYNDMNSLNDHNVNGYKQFELGAIIRKKEPYIPLVQDKPPRADLVIFSYDRPLQLYALLESIQKYVTGLGDIHVIYRISEAVYNDSYKEVIKDFSYVHFHKQGPNPLEDFGSLTLKAAFKSPNDYILFAVDDIIVKDFISISDDIALLKKYNAYGFFYRLGTHLSFCHTTNSLQRLPLLKTVEKDIVSWHFSDKESEGDWAYPNNVDMTLYLKKDIKEDLYAIPLTTPSFEMYWNNRAHTVKDRLGLCHELSKIVNIPLNRVQNDCINPHMGIAKEALLELFNNGFKIDIEPLFRMKNSGAHTECDLVYKERAIVN